MTPSPRHSTRLGAIATAILLGASGAILVPAASAVTGATTHVMTTGRYHIELPGNGPRDVALGVPIDVMHDGTSSAGVTGGNAGVEGGIPCGGIADVRIKLGQAYSGTAGGTADFGSLRASADARIENTPATIICPDTTPMANSYPGNAFTDVTATFDDLITVGSASGLPAGTMKHLRFTAVLGATVSGSGGTPTLAAVLYTVTASVGFGSPTVNTSLNALGFAETFPPSGQSSLEVDVAVGTPFRYSGVLDASTLATGGTLAIANADSGVARAFIDSDDPDVVITSASLHDYRSSAVSAATTTTTSTLPPTATLHLVSGDSFLLKISAAPRKRRAAFTSSDPTFSTAGLDPRTGGAEVRLFGPDTGASDVWTLPATGWTLKKGKYRYGDKAHAYGPVTSAIVANRHVALEAKGAAITYPLLGTAQQAIALALVLPAGSAEPAAAVCAEFPGAERKGLFKAAKAKAPVSCRALR